MESGCGVAVGCGVVVGCGVAVDGNRMGVGVGCGVAVGAGVGIFGKVTGVAVAMMGAGVTMGISARSAERRVGKECRSRGSSYQ